MNDWTLKQERRRRGVLGHICITKERRDQGATLELAEWRQAMLSCAPFLSFASATPSLDRHATGPLDPGLSFRATAGLSSPTARLEPILPKNLSSFYSASTFASLSSLSHFVNSFFFFGLTVIRFFGSSLPFTRFHVHPSPLYVPITALTLDSVRPTARPLFLFTSLLYLISLPPSRCRPSCYMPTTAAQHKNKVVVVIPVVFSQEIDSCVDPPFTMPPTQHPNGGLF